MKPNVPHAATMLVLSAAVAALASCGGGGGGGASCSPPGAPASTPAALTAGNMVPVTADVLNFSLGSFVGVGSSLSSKIGEVPLSAQPTALPRTRSLIGLLRQQFATLGTRSPMANPFVPLAPVPSDCDNVGVGSRVTDAQPTMTTVNFINCLSNGETINGQLSLTNIMAPAANETTGHVTHNLKFTQAGLPDLSSSGGFDIDHKTDTGTNVVTDTLTGGPVTLAIGSGCATDNAIISGFTITSASDLTSSNETNTVAGTFATNVIGGSVTVATPTPILTVRTSQFPSTGQLIINGASNSVVRFTVLGDETTVGDQVTFELDPGTGTFQPPVGLQWTDPAFPSL